MVWPAIIGNKMRSPGNKMMTRPRYANQKIRFASPKHFCDQFLGDIWIWGQNRRLLHHLLLLDFWRTSSRISFTENHYTSKTSPVSANLDLCLELIIWLSTFFLISVLFLHESQMFCFWSWDRSCKIASVIVTLFRHG